MRGFFMAEKTKKLPDSRKQRHAALPAGNFGQIMRFFMRLQNSRAEHCGKKNVLQAKKKRTRRYAFLLISIKIMPK